MKGAAQFYQDFLVEDPKTHYMVVCPSNSPENNPGIGSYTDDNGKTMKIALFSGVAMDNQMVYDLLRNTAFRAESPCSRRAKNCSRLPPAFSARIQAAP